MEMKGAARWVVLAAGCCACGSQPLTPTAATALGTQPGTGLVVDREQQDSATESRPGWRPVEPPPITIIGIDRGWKWYEIDAPEDHKLLAAALRPPGPGPFPVVVYLHGGGGFEGSLIRKNQLKGFVPAGYMVVMGCWFDGYNETNVPVMPAEMIDCPDAPQFADLEGQGRARDRFFVESLPYAETLVRAARLLPDADPARVGVIGDSRGAAAAVLMAQRGIGVQAIVADSAPYGESPFLVASSMEALDAPLLIVHGTADALCPIQTAYDFETALRALGKPYEARYYEGARHGVDSGSNPDFMRSDMRTRTIAFFSRYLGYSAISVAGDTSIGGAHDLLDTFSPVRLLADHSLRERIIRAEREFRATGEASISNDRAVYVINAMVDILGAPAWARTNIEQLRAVRLESGRASSSAMSPLDTVVATMSLANRKMRDPEYQMDPADWTVNRRARLAQTPWNLAIPPRRATTELLLIEPARLAIERALSDEESDASRRAHQFLDMLNIRR